uniref:Delta(14)-sterol reductase TM7SF2 n=1 Tax=Anolis carolinensis TaxID=28377 RepID=A0A803SZ84_ANOCA
MEPTKVPRTTELEFGGPWGAALLTLLLPGGAFYLLLVSGTPGASVLSVPAFPAWRSLWDPTDLGLVLAWIAAQALLAQAPLGKVTEGTPLRDKARLQYRINGCHALGVTGVVLGAGLAGGLRLSYVYNHFLQLAFAATLVAFALSLLLYIKALVAPPSALAPGGNSGNPVYDFFLGHELNWLLRPQVLLRAETRSPGMGGDQHGNADEGGGGPRQPLAGHGPGQRLPAALRGGRFVARGGGLDHHGHPAGRLWLHAGLWGPGLGALPLQPPGSLLGHSPPQGQPPCGRRHHPPERASHAAHGHGATAAGERVVGPGAAPQLPGGPPHGLGLVTHLRSDPRAALLLPGLLPAAAAAPGGTGRAPLPAPVRPGLGGVLPEGPLPHPALRLLKMRKRLWLIHGISSLLLSSQHGGT